MAIRIAGAAVFGKLEELKESSVSIYVYLFGSQVALGYVGILKDSLKTDRTWRVINTTAPHQGCGIIFHESMVSRIMVPGPDDQELFPQIVLEETAGAINLNGFTI